MPSNATAFWKSLLRKKLPPTCLSQLQFTIFGLGDSSYPKSGQPMSIKEARADILPVDLTGLQENFKSASYNLVLWSSTQRERAMRDTTTGECCLFIQMATSYLAPIHLLPPL